MTRALLLLMLTSSAMAQRGVQRFTIRAEGLNIDGEHFEVGGWNPPSAPGEPESVGLRIGGDSFALDLWSPGCALRGNWVWAMEATDSGDAYWARVARTRAPRSVRRARYGEASTVGCGDRLRFDDGTVALIETIESRNREVTLVRLRIGGDVYQVQAQATAYEQRFTDDIQVTPGTTTETWLLGSPRISLKIVRSSAIVIEAQSGEIVTVPHRARARIGRFYARYGGCGEMLGMDGDQAFCDIEVELGTRRGRNMVFFNEPWEWEGHRIELLGTDENGARMRLTVP